MSLHQRLLRRLTGAAKAFLAGVTLCVFAAAGTVQGAELRLQPNESRLLALAGEPATVIVGNPLYADVTVLDNRIVVQGRSFGKTGIIVMDAAGRQLANLQVVVAGRDKDRLTVYKGGQRFSYLCMPNCERTVEIGDSIKDSAAITAQMKQKMSITRSAAQLNQ